MGYDWTTSLPEIRAFIGILYARGAYGAKNLKLSYLWSDLVLETLCPETRSSKFDDIFVLIKEPKEVGAYKQINLPWFRKYGTSLLRRVKLAINQGNI